MNDTPLHIAKIQYEIHISKPISERIMGAFDLSELSRRILYNQLKQKYTELSDAELRIELFKICYRDYFDEAKMQNITSHMLISLQRNNSNKDSIIF